MNAQPAGAARRGPRTRRVSTLIPVVVAGSMALLVAWAAWPVLRPVAEVRVVQAVFVRDESPASRPHGEPADRSVPAVQAPGWLEAEPYLTACTALADGVLERLEVLEGDFVEAGQVVARLVADDAKIRLRLAEAALSDAVAALENARAEHAAAQRSWDEPIEIERAVESSLAAVAEGEGELAQLPALIASASATLARLEEETRRVRRSTEQGAATELERIQAEQREAAQRAEVLALAAREPILVARLDRLRSEARAAERRLSLRIEDRLRLDSSAAAVSGAQSRVDRATAARDEAALELDRMTIRAPIAGFVQRRLKVPGDKVVRMMDDPHSAHLVHLYDPARVQVRVDVPLADASHVYVGQPCEVFVEVLPDRAFRGEVLRSTHEADLQKNTLQFKVKVIDPDPILRPEMLTRVRFLASGPGAAREPSDGTARVRIPEAALDPAGGAPRVWVVADRSRGRGVLSARPVTVVERSEGWATIAGDIQPGALIAVVPQEPREGQAVAFRAEAAEKEAGS